MIQWKRPRKTCHLRILQRITLPFCQIIRGQVQSIRVTRSFLFDKCSGLNLFSSCQQKSGGQDIFVSQLNRKGNAFKYSTFLGGSGWDVANAIALDKKGAIYLTGYTHSPNYPLWEPLSRSNLSRNRTIVTKFKPRGDALEFSTFIGGSSGDSGFGIAVDSDGSVYVTGITTSPDFPMVSPVFRFYSGGGGDAFIVKIRYSPQ